ncbi:DUF4328 domain-containing protein [Kutzneria sp. CA-103260]|uniref:DUF4328 domain-containing protein n=1 Tax=Kutzneria sp. CA-103260 TaxID=2802641 RepID=UPI001BABC509|nr:DUF4328 domain-containing protein [Kutzneria sp. CA-103260]QUQ69895.1 hypothetical protein JJ691_76620 [Kutzneria sp. CA-103260]
MAGRWQWVATPPPQAGAPRSVVRRPLPYTGPPSYPVPPRWGFPQLSWRWPVSLGRRATPKPLDQPRMLSRNLVATLWVTTAALGVAAVGEGWRYVLLILSRGGALSRSVVAFSDALVVTAGVVSGLAAVASLVLAVLWVLRARDVAATVTGQRPSRPLRDVLIGLLVPGLNLAVAGSILAELEHAAARKSVTERPRPSRLLRLWWISWVVGEVLFAVVWLLMLFGTSVQALANGVELHLVADLVAAFVAATGALFVTRITLLLEPVDLATVSRLRVLKVVDAPEPPLRATRPVGSPR